MDASGESKSKTPTVVKLRAIDATPSTFKDYGQVIEASPDGDEFGPHDAQLDLSRGTPRSLLTFLEYDCALFICDAKSDI